MNVRLYLWQRATAALMVPLVLIHIAVIFYATRQGMTAADILSRTHGSIVWASYYGLVRRRRFNSRRDRRAQRFDRMVAAHRSRAPASLLIVFGLLLGGARCARRSSPWCCHDRAAGTMHRGSALWIAAMIHRLSGLALAIFLPLHFLALGLAIDGEAKLESFLRWTDQPLVKFAEGGLVFLLTVHLLGGLRVLVIENLDWRDGQKQLATLAAAVSAIVAFIFLARVF